MLTMFRFQLICLASFGIFQLTISYPEPKRSLVDIPDDLAVLPHYQLQSLKKFTFDEVLSKKTVDPEATMSIEDIIRYHGYPVELFHVTTEDGYILTIQRIPYGTSGPTATARKPVLVQHGLLCSSASWVTNTKDKNLPYILADAGYDVWLGNIRGTLYGRNHTRLNPKNDDFWEYSFDEMARYDVPAVIDTILKQTGYQQILYIGHSMGTTIGFAMLASQPKYNKIVRTMFALAPVATLAHGRTPLRLLAPFTSEAAFTLDLFGTGEFLPNSNIIKILSNTICTSPVRILCSSVLFIICGFDLAQLNQTRLPVFLHHTPAATSIQNLVHFGQLVRSGKFQYHDYGAKKNKIVYGQLQAPLYEFSKITTQVALFWSDNDYLADPRDVNRLAQSLPNLVSKYRVPLTKFSHMDFIWAIDIKELLYDKLLNLMAKSWKD